MSVEEKILEEGMKSFALHLDQMTQYFHADATRKYTQQSCDTAYMNINGTFDSVENETKR